MPFHAKAHELLRQTKVRSSAKATMPQQRHRRHMTPCIHPRQYLSLHVGKKQKRKMGCILPYLRYEMPRHIDAHTEADDDEAYPHNPSVHETLE